MRFARIARLFYRMAEGLLVAMLAILFVAFILQITFRYLLNLPIGWTSELTVIAWLWLVLWGAALVLREDEEIRFDLVYGAAGRQTRRVMTILASLALICLYAGSLPAVIDYVTFMKVQSTAYMKIRFDYLFSIYLIFALAVLIRYGRIFWRAVREGDGEDDPAAERNGSRDA